jgi:hypothetical protein
MKTITVRISEHFKRGKFNGYKKFIYGRQIYVGLNISNPKAEQLATALVEAADTLKKQQVCAPTAMDQAGRAAFHFRYHIYRCSECCVDGGSEYS